MHFKRITHDPAVMGGRPCIRGLRITVATILDLLGDGTSRERILQAYPQLEPDDIKEALAYACAELPQGPAAPRTTRSPQRDPPAPRRHPC
jgi:uncharacterized protein (DUF433 family)